MPVMDGFAATRHIRAHEKSAPGQPSRTQIVALTAPGHDAQEEHEEEMELLFTTRSIRKTFDV